MKTKAFTLIEVMVVLSILAIIAILGYNFFGSSMKEAKLSAITTEHIKNLNFFQSMAEDHVLQTGAYPGSMGTLKTWARDNGRAKYWPIKPDGSATPGNYTIGVSDIGGPPGGLNDMYITTTISLDECVDFNKRLHPDWPWTDDYVFDLSTDGSFTDFEPYNSMACLKAGASYSIYSLVYYD